MLTINVKDKKTLSSRLNSIKQLHTLVERYSSPDSSPVTYGLFRFEGTTHVSARSRQNAHRGEHSIEVNVQVESTTDSGNSESNGNNPEGGSGSGSGDDDDGGGDDDGGDGEYANPINVVVNIKLQSSDYVLQQNKIRSLTDKKGLRAKKPTSQKITKLMEHLVGLVFDVIAQIAASVIVKLMGF